MKIVADRAAALARLLAEPLLARALDALDAPGEETRVVGGAVRDVLLGLPHGDVDLATTLAPQETMRRAGRAGLGVAPTGLAHGTVTVVVEGRPFEVTSLREDVATDGRHATVRFGRDFAADAARRDFTINALSLSRDGALHDTVGGLADLEAGRVRFIGEAAARVREDRLRILRFYRFGARFSAGAPDSEGVAATIAGRGGLADLSRERVGAETLRLLAAPRAADAIEAMAGAGLVLPVFGGPVRPVALARVAGAEI
ncbi:MAG: CCA tRNA nucleotidyltransferase, partial [Hyphomicrobiales bacterium]|nr:CCA tRNA nucleotidyltransferase [Hyphomicrobiales bacterium]